MNWISELLKHLNNSRSFVVATFASSMVLLFGNRFFPNLIPQTPNDWKLFAIIGVVFSGTILLFCLFPFVWKLLCKTFTVKVQKISASNLSHNEVNFLLFLANIVGKGGNDCLNIDSLNYSAMKITKLEAIEITSSLSKKGLLSLNLYDSDLVSFTPDGRRKAIKLKSGN